MKQPLVPLHAIAIYPASDLALPLDYSYYVEVVVRQHVINKNKLKYILPSNTPTKSQDSHRSKLDLLASDSQTRRYPQDDII